MTRPAFACQRCNQCCTGDGGIRLPEEDVPAAAAILELTPEEFKTRYCRREQGQWAIRCGEDDRCLLLGPQGCRIHEAKPAICRAWPYFPALLKDPGAFAEAKLICPGLNPEASHQEFLAQYRQTIAKEEDPS